MCIKRLVRWYKGLNKKYDKALLGWMGELTKNIDETDQIQHP